MNLEDCRVKIDEVDKKLVEAFQTRMRLVEEVVKYKLEHNIPILDSMRERKKLEEVVSMADNDMSSYVQLLYNTIFQMSKDHQQKFVYEKSSIVQEIEYAINNTEKVFPKKAVVACQGVEGAYSQQACDKIFKMPRIVYVKNFNGVFASIKEGLCQYGILPLENSTAGSVNQIYDLMMKYNFHIVRSLKYKINHCLLVNIGTKIEDIKEIVSHEQAIGQCEEYLKKFKNVKITICENTAEAAKLVSNSNRNNIAAIASNTTAELYNLKCLESDIQDQGNNYTRFICISKNLEIYPGANRTSIMMVIPHKPGSLYNILSKFYALGINLLKLESRPIPNRNFDFMFYFDIEVEAYSKEFIRLIEELENVSQEFKYLGSYLEIQ